MIDDLTFPAPADAAILTAELLIVGYVKADGTNGFMVHTRGDMPATTFLGLTVMAQRKIEKWAER